jgi:hypothetical protein
MRRYEHSDVIDHTRVIGIVDEVLGDHAGVPTAFVVADGWLDARRFLLPCQASKRSTMNNARSRSNANRTTTSMTAPAQAARENTHVVTIRGALECTGKRWVS